MSSSDTTIRPRVLDGLSLIASVPQMAAVRPDLSAERYAFLVCQMWFDEVYTPGTRYMTGIKGDRDTEAADAFLAHFDEDEVRWLERFNRFLELRIDRLADMDAGLIVPGERWDSIVRDAGYLVELLGGNPRRSGSALADAVRDWLPPGKGVR